jgi:L-fucose isomerase-like protein
VREARRFSDSDVDAIILCPIVWTNDPPVIAFIQEAKRVPLLLWAYSPYIGLLDDYRIAAWLRSSGPVSVQQVSNLFRRFGWNYESVFGNERETETMDGIRAFACAAATRSSLSGARIAVLPSPCRMVMASWADEFHILERFGVELVYVPVDEYARIARAVNESEAEDYAEWLQARFPVVGVSEEELLESARQALAFVALAEEKALSGIALEDFDPWIIRKLGFRPHLTHPRLSEMGCTVGLEADVLNVISTLIVSRLANRPAMFNELFSIDPYENIVLMGHPGHGEFAFGAPDTYVVTRDLEFDLNQPAGAWLSYRAKPGMTTSFNMTPEHGRIKAAAFTGESLPGPRCMEGYSHMKVRTAADTRKLFHRIVEMGLIQHWGTVHGEIRAELRMFASMVGLTVEELG